MCVHVNVWYRIVSLSGRGAEVGGVQLLHILHDSSQKKTYVHSSRLVTAYVVFCLMRMLKECERKGRRTQVIEGR